MAASPTTPTLPGMDILRFVRPLNQPKRSRTNGPQGLPAWRAPLAGARSYPQRVNQDPELSQAFLEVLRGIKNARVRGDVRLVEVPAPTRIAPFAVALEGEVVLDDRTASDGRFIVLHDPAGQEAWKGTFRVVALMRAELEPGEASDDLWGQWAWSWIEETLSGVPHTCLGGTVTRVTDECFGELADRGRTVSVEIRVSWTPSDTVIAPHLEAWANLLAHGAGVPPLPDGVTQLPGKYA
jgi:hypothetical protein